MTQSDSAKPVAGANLKSSLSAIVAIAFMFAVLWVMPGTLWMFDSTVITMVSGATALIYLSDRTRLGRWFYRFVWNWFHWGVQMPPWDEIPKEKWRGWIYNQPPSQKLTVAGTISVLAFVFSYVHLGLGVSLLFQLVLAVLDVPAALLGMVVGYGAHHLLLHRLPFMDNIDKLKDLDVSEIGSTLKRSVGSLARSVQIEPAAPAQPPHAESPRTEPAPPEEDPRVALNRYLKG